MSFYVCTRFDEFDKKTGFYVMKLDCINWDESILGPWSGAKYNSKEECYSKSICAKSDSSTPDIPDTSNNYCGISIKNISLIERTIDTLIVDVELPENYENTYLEYALYDIDNNLLSDFKRVAGGSLQSLFTLIISDFTENVCAVAFRLVRPCETIGSESGSDESGSKESGTSGSEESGSGSGIDENILFDKNSWVEIVPSPFATWLDIAADAWHTVIKVDNNVVNIIRDSIDPNWNGISLVSYTEINDPSAGYVAACGPVNIIDIEINDPLNIKYNAYNFQLIINTYYYNNPLFPLSAADWIGVMKHELGHALGIGTLWSTTIQNFLPGTGQYSNAMLAYNTLVGNPSSARPLLPIEDSGGPLTIGAHWENNYRNSSYVNGQGFDYPSCNFDVMVAFISLGNPKGISNLSKQFLIDIGYQSNGNSLPAIIINNIPSINLSSASTISNMCGCSEHCCDHNSLGTINLIDKTFIPIS